MTTWYRFEDKTYSVCINPDGDQYGSYLDVELLKFTAVKSTPKGTWIESQFGRKRFVLHNAHKHYACPTIEQAWESFEARKRKQASIYEKRQTRALEAIKLGKWKFRRELA